MCVCSAYMHVWVFACAGVYVCVLGIHVYVGTYVCVLAIHAYISAYMCVEGCSAHKHV